MKKIFFVFTCMLSGLLLFAQDDNSIVNDISVNVIRDARLSNQLRAEFRNLGLNSGDVIAETGLHSFSESDFDFTNIYKSEKTGEKGVGYSVKCYNPPNGYEVAFSVVVVDEKLLKPMIIKTRNDRSQIVFNDAGEQIS